MWETILSHIYYEHTYRTHRVPPGGLQLCLNMARLAAFFGGSVLGGLCFGAAMKGLAFMQRPLGCGNLRFPCRQVMEAGPKHNGRRRLGPRHSRVNVFDGCGRYRRRGGKLRDPGPALLHLCGPKTHHSRTRVGLQRHSN